jgi:hypothetical protein
MATKNTETNLMKEADEPGKDRQFQGQQTWPPPAPRVLAVGEEVTLKVTVASIHPHAPQWVTVDLGDSEFTGRPATCVRVNAKQLS